jgi:hypothetical protein
MYTIDNMFPPRFILNVLKSLVNSFGLSPMLFPLLYRTHTNRIESCLIQFNRFCKLKGHEMFCEVERSYIEDGFNLYGLRACVSNFSDCLDLILDRIGPDDSDDSHLTQSACTLYGLIHARYIITAHGLDAMYNKVSKVIYCIIVLCCLLFV